MSATRPVSGHTRMSTSGARAANAALHAAGSSTELANSIAIAAAPLPRAAGDGCLPCPPPVPEVKHTSWWPSRSPAGLTIWSGAIFRLAAGLAFTLSLIVAGYAAVISFSPSGAVTLVATAVLASLALAGWWRFLRPHRRRRRVARGRSGGGFRAPRPRPGRRRGAPRRSSARRPWRSTSGSRRGCARPRATDSRSPPACRWRRWRSPFRSPRWRTKAGCRAASGSTGSAVLAVCVLVAAVAALGPMSWLLLEENATDILAAHLPAALAPYSLGAVRSAGLIVVLLSTSAASCVWAASYWLTRIR